MPKRHGNLMARIADPDNLREAYRKTALGKRDSWGYLEFREYADLNLARLRDELLSGQWRQSPAREFYVFEPKRRLISALPFKDRVAQHALVNAVGPIFDASLLPYTFACRVGMGTHAGVRHIQAQMRRTGATHFLKTDYRAFFPSIDRAILHALIERQIKCRATLELLAEMVPADGVGLPIGNLTSQIGANLYGGMIDRFIHVELGCRHWARYMDDIVVLGSNPYELRHQFEDIQAFSEQCMRLSISKWHVSPVNHGVNFLGFRIWPRHKLLRKRSVIAAKRKIGTYRRHARHEDLRRFVASWRGHARHADTRNLLNHLESKYGIDHQHPR